MNITILPFKSVKAMADINTSEIFVGNSFLRDDTENNIKHEFAHILSQDPDHGKKFYDHLNDLGGNHTEDKDIFKGLRKHLGIPLNIAANIGSISGIQNMLLDYHLLAAYRKFSQAVLGTTGHWEMINEGTSTVTDDSITAKDQLIRLYPTPKGAFPVTVLYIPVVTHFRSPQARLLAYEMMLAEAKIAIGNARRKISGMPTPDGGSISYDGEALVSEGQKAKDEIIQKAISLGEPVGPFFL